MKNLRYISVCSILFKKHGVFRNVNVASRFSSNVVNVALPSVKINGCTYPTDRWTNVTPKVLSFVGKNIHMLRNHPLSLVRQRIVNFFHKSFVGRTGNALFSIYDDLNPVVSVEENFDSLLIPQDHPSRKKSDCYYVNQSYLLRAHTTAHQSQLINMGLNNFLIIGDVYRRDQIDSTHYPVFHQVDGVRLRTAQDLYTDGSSSPLSTVFENNTVRTTEKQEHYNSDSSILMAREMKKTLEKLAMFLFGEGVQTRWVDAYFPFTHPSWELEIFHEGSWLEVLGCGIIEHEILKAAGADNHIGWAFGLGLERLAMHLYKIPDIRLFWSSDSGFLSQFQVTDINQPIKYKPISSFPQCINDISFWLPTVDKYSTNDFYDLVRSIGGDLIEQVSLVDEFTHPKKNMTSHCYRIVYRHMEKTLTQKEVNDIHKKIGEAATSSLKVLIR